MGRATVFRGLTLLAGGLAALLSGCCCLGLEHDQDLPLPRQLLAPVAVLQVGARAVADATGVAPFAVTFDASESHDPDGSIVKYDWDFNNDGEFETMGGTVTEPYDYPEAGVFTARVRVTDNDGLTGEATTTVTVGSPLVPPVARGTATQAAAGSTVANFDGSASTDADGTIVKYDWDFDHDGTYELADAGPTPTHDYGALGTFTAGLRVTDNDGLTSTTDVPVTLTALPNVPPVAALTPTPPSGIANPQLDVVWDASASTDSDGTIASYDWDMDNDGTYEITNGGATQNASYTTTGIHTVGVRVTDDDGATNSTTNTVDVNLPPVAVVTPSLAAGDAPLQVTWDASASSDPDGTIVSFDWDMDNDGTYEIINGGTSQSAVYNTSGVHTVGLRVTDNDGATDAATNTVDVNMPPVAALAPNPPSGNKPLSVTWDASGSTDSDGTIVSYDWDMDNDGSFEITNGGPTQAAAYPNVGTFTVGVRVTDNDGGMDQTTATATVTGQPPVARLTGTPEHPFSPANITWDASTSSDPDGSIVSYDWDMDNDGTFEILNGGPSQTANYGDGTFTVRVRVHDDDGQTDQTTATVTLFPG